MGTLTTIDSILMQIFRWLLKFMKSCTFHATYGRQKLLIDIHKYSKTVILFRFISTTIWLTKYKIKNIFLGDIIYNLLYMYF